jgi:hypothetical protein
MPNPLSKYVHWKHDTVWNFKLDLDDPKITTNQNGGYRSAKWSSDNRTYKYTASVRLCSVK